MSAETRTVIICDLCKRQLMPLLSPCTTSVARFHARAVHGWVRCQVESGTHPIDLCKDCNEANAIVTRDMVTREAVKA